MSDESNPTIKKCAWCDVFLSITVSPDGDKLVGGRDYRSHSGKVHSKPPFKWVCAEDKAQECWDRGRKLPKNFNKKVCIDERRELGENK